MPSIQVEKVATLKGHQDSIYTLERSSAENVFFSGAGDGMVAQWDLSDLKDGQLVAKMGNSVYAIHYLPTNNRLVIGQNFEGLHLIDLATNQEIKNSKITDKAIFDIRSFQDKLIVACGDGEVIVALQDSLESIKRIKLTIESARTVAISEKLNEFAVGYSDNVVRIFDLSSYELKKELKTHKNSVFTLKFSKDDKTLISAGRDAQIKVWDTGEYHELKSIPAHMYAINNIEFSNDGNYFATGSMDKSIKLWDAESYDLLKVIDKSRHAGHGTSINKLLWSTYKDYLIAGSDDRTISVWEIKF